MQRQRIPFGPIGLRDDGEARVLSRIKEALGFPQDAFGALADGVSMAHAIALAAAGREESGSPSGDRLSGSPRRGRSPWKLPRHLTLYASRRVHAPVLEAALLLGLEGEGLHLVPVDARSGIKVKSLRRAIQEDLYSGRRLPFAIVATAGTGRGGTMDDLAGLAEVARKTGLWLHVDAALGTGAVPFPWTRIWPDGMVGADSLAFDLREWMQLPHEAACVLIRHRVFSPPQA